MIFVNVSCVMTIKSLNLLNGCPTQLIIQLSIVRFHMDGINYLIVDIGHEVVENTQ